MQQDEAPDDFIRNRLRIEYFYFLKETVSLSLFSSNPVVICFCRQFFCSQVELSILQRMHAALEEEPLDGEDDLSWWLQVPVVKRVVV